VDRGFERDVWTVTWDSGVVSGWGCTGATSGDGGASGCVAGASEAGAPVRDGDSEAGASVRDGDSSDGTACCGGGDAWAHALFEPAPVRAR
jgi:hypothetical protein